MDIYNLHLFLCFLINLNVKVLKVKKYENALMIV